MVTLRVVRHDRDLVLAECSERRVLPSRGEVATARHPGRNGREVQTEHAVARRFGDACTSRPSPRRCQRDGSARGPTVSRSPCCRTSRSSPNSPRRPRRSYPSRRCDGRSVEPRSGRRPLVRSRPRDAAGCLSMYTADAGAAGASARVAAAAGVGVGIRRTPHAASPLSGSHRRARPVAVARDARPMPRTPRGSNRKRAISRIETIRRFRRRTTTGRRSR